MSAPSSNSPPGHVDYDPYGLSPVQVTVKENDEVVPAVGTPKGTLNVALISEDDGAYQNDCIVAEPSIKQEEEDDTDCCKEEEATPSDDSIKAFVADISGLGRDLECLTDEFISLGSYQTVTGQRSSSYSASPEAITSRSPHPIDQLCSPASANSAAGNVFQRSNNPSPEPRPVAPEYQADSDWYMIMPTPTGDNPSAPATESSTQAGWLYTPDEEPRVAFPQGANVPLAQGYASQAANWRTANEEPVSPGPWSNRRGPVTPPISYLHLHRHPTSIWRRPLCNNQACLRCSRRHRWLRFKLTQELRNTRSLLESQTCLAGQHRRLQCLRSLRSRLQVLRELYNQAGITNHHWNGFDDFVEPPPMLWTTPVACTGQVHQRPAQCFSCHRSF
ncbi:hypothetical protein D9613_003849 [Agrocybe pediades]|uniref:Uncharacterized protein n=1 Tax=Agrocybe pediades TaxID=84607 RepID=A0A8H4QJM4_9AGAR|nr:hypothetical protein D9613_003849 [Agrocybe pediades]